MKKEYWYILIIYIFMQLSSIFGAPLFTAIAAFYKKDSNASQLKMIGLSSWVVFSFTITLLIVLFILRKEIKYPQYERNATSTGVSIAWAFGGVFLAMFAQAVAVAIELKLGIETGSQNTEDIVSAVEYFPLMIVVVTILGPILEEIVFRKIIFGSLQKRFNFFISAFISSIIFALAHVDFSHIIIYTAMGFTFSFLYVKTKRIIVPMFAHIAMNTLVLVVQFLASNELENYIK
ncbi:CPBP family intramembrane metalloprotease [Bacillus aquiflavi]|uniref:CPBP family intramembrane metalloprotease n=1 Tax=Bacillus aquiflavi TaxID=2672567 RepID=A0A6B3W378_9BACI|nr:type II CAAX endopeptidase family protein [Bacillus aquiflavi]MBA4538585.1 CPBP family intramembrane metalloprotease [Bacillus aquiflavi]NEY82947.1 CPBP family intramembrane metalloprotease [Bacillus aquiflavi]UAC48507.1 CPBP family intramembrane metalloprotease [Bacillus aquiflavi]